MEATEVCLFSKVSLCVVRNMRAQYRNEQAAAAQWSPRFPLELFCMDSVHILVVIAILSMLALFIECGKNIM